VTNKKREENVLMKNLKYIYEVELEQITPYVNEIDREGKDILRPTEFKPRFDKFLIRKYEEEIINYFDQEDIISKIKRSQAQQLLRYTEKGLEIILKRKKYVKYKKTLEICSK